MPFNIFMSLPVEKNNSKTSYHAIIMQKKFSALSFWDPLQQKKIN